MEKSESSMRVRKGEAPIIVFKFIAARGPVSKYEIHRELGLNYSTVFYAVNELLEKRAIQVVGKFPSSKNRLSVNKYDLTFEGGLAAFLLLVEEKDIEGLRRVVRRLSNFIGPVFSKWDFFIEKGVENLVIKGITSAIKANAHALDALLKVPSEGDIREDLKLLVASLGKPMTIAEEFAHHVQKIRETTAELLAHRIMKDFIISLIDGAMCSFPEYEGLLKLFIADPELRQFVESVVDEAVKEHRARIRLLNEAKKKFLS